MGGFPGVQSFEKYSMAFCSFAESSRYVLLDLAKVLVYNLLDSTNIFKLLVWFLLDFAIFQKLVVRN